MEMRISAGCEDVKEALLFAAIEMTDFGNEVIDLTSSDDKLQPRDSLERDDTAFEQATRSVDEFSDHDFL